MKHPRAEKLLHGDAFSRYLYAAEQNIDINGFCVDGLHLWPLLRLVLAWRLHSFDAQLNPALSADPIWRATIAAIENASRLAQETYGVRHAGDQPPAAFLPPEDTPLHSSGEGRGVLFFVRAEEHYLGTADGYYAPVLDPWLEVVREGFKVFKLEPLSDLSRERMPRRHHTLLAQTTRLQLAPEEKVYLRALCEQANRLADDVAAWSLSAFGLSLPGLGEELREHLASMFRSRLFFDEILENLAPRAVFLNCYYHPTALGLIWAARRAGIRTIEVQHGTNGACHLAYTHWTRLPDSGYALLPDVFLTWGLGSANNIARWFPAGHSAHHVAIGGKLAKKRDPAPAGSPLDALAQSARSASKTVLVTLQWTDDTALTPLMLAVMRQAPPDWFWMVRCHPMAEYGKVTCATVDNVERRLAEEGIVNCESRVTSDSALSDVLSLCSHHLTHTSSTIYEAIEYGVPTTVTHPAALGLYGSLIEDRLAHFATDPETIVATILAGKNGLDWERIEMELVSDTDLARRQITRWCT